uniref:Uncharacterized protein n=1 Tax=Arundo donax TaxID=35708 RepID=A0A0A9B396_ARUDO
MGGSRRPNRVGAEVRTCGAVGFHREASRGVVSGRSWADPSPTWGGQKPSLITNIPLLFSHAKKKSRKKCLFHDNYA